MPMPTTQILRLPAVQERVGLKRSAIYDAIKCGDFPKPIKLTKRAVGWKAEDVSAWIAGKIAAAENAA